jgi:hypothetical protein
MINDPVPPLTGNFAIYYFTYLSFERYVEIDIALCRCLSIPV